MRSFDELHPMAAAANGGGAAVGAAPGDTKPRDDLAATQSAFDERAAQPGRPFNRISRVRASSVR